MTSTVLLFSGGLDSTTMLYHLRAEGHDVICLGIDYGQTHRRELAGAASIAADLDVPFETVTLDGRMFDGSALTAGGDSVIVPNRNAVFISLAGAVALRDGLDGVAIACHKGDHELWPDCRGRFLDAMQQVLFTCDNRRISLLRPFLHKTKLEVVRLGYELGVPFDRTWTCYEGGEEPCGTCVACLGRREALFLAGVPCTA